MWCQNISTSLSPNASWLQFSAAACTVTSENKRYFPDTSFTVSAGKYPRLARVSLSCLCHDWASCEILSNPINTSNLICTVTCLIFVSTRRHQSSPTTSALKHTMRVTNTLIWFLMMLYTVCQNAWCPQAIVSRQPNLLLVWVAAHCE